MLKRLIEEDLEYWKKNGSTRAFILEGARQTGKTFILDWFCKNNFNNYLYIDLLKDKNSLALLKTCRSTEDYLNMFNYIAKSTLVPNDTVIFIDEVQEYKEIITQIKFLAIDKRYRYILSGSLIGLLIHDIKSIPLGYSEFHHLYPLTFEEFLIASSVPKQVIDIVKNSLKDLKEIPSAYYHLLSDLFSKYLITGGMPCAVMTYLETHNFQAMFKVQDYILGVYDSDFTKYEKIEKKLELHDLYLSIATQLNKEYKRFYLKDYKTDCRFAQIQSSLLWMILAGCAHKINLVNDLTEGLIKTDKESFKLYINDVGILVAMYGEPFRFNLISQNKNTNFGMIYENFVCQELRAKKHTPYYFKSKKHGEVEFIYFDRETGMITPIEVKSGKDYQVHKSLDYVLNTYKNIKKGYVLGNTNVKVEDNIIYLPIWSIGLIPGFDYTQYQNISNVKIEI